MGTALKEGKDGKLDAGGGGLMKQNARVSRKLRPKT